MSGPRAGLGLSDSGGELALGVVLILVLVALCSIDCSGAILSGTHLVALSSAGQFLIAAILHAGSPMTRWPEPHVRQVPAALFWLLAGVLAVLPLGVLAVVGLAVGHRRGVATSGFASVPELRREASLEAARRAAETTRPSLDPGKAPQAELGYPLGRSTSPRGIELVASWEHSLQLVAPPGAGKTLRVLAPILRQHPGPVLATSTKADLYETSVGARRRIGPVLALDPEGLCPGAEPLRWSPVSGCAAVAVAERRAGALVAATGEGSDMRSGGFFRRSATAVLAAYLHAAALEGVTMRNVLSWAAHPNDPAPLRVLSSQGDKSVDWAARLHAHTSGSAETTSGVMRTVDLALACFSDPLVLEQVSIENADAFDFERFFTERGTLFALGKDRSGGTAPLITAFSDELTFAAEQFASRALARRLDPPLLCCLDEAPSIVPLPSLPTLVADGRGRGIVVVLAMQSFSQAAERWGLNGAATIRNAASILCVFGGLSVASDLDELSRLTGTRQVVRHSYSTDHSGRASTSRHLAEEPVLSPSEVRSLPAGTALLFWGRLPPVLTHLPGIWQGKGAQQIALEERIERERNDEGRKRRDLQQ